EGEERGRDRERRDGAGPPPRERAGLRFVLVLLDDLAVLLVGHDPLEVGPHHDLRDGTLAHCRPRSASSRGTCTGVTVMTASPSCARSERSNDAPRRRWVPSVVMRITSAGT